VCYAIDKTKLIENTSINLTSLFPIYTAMKVISRISAIIIGVLFIALLIICSYSNEFDEGVGVTWKFGAANSTPDTPTHNFNVVPRVLPKDLPIIIWWTENLYPHLDKFDTLSCSSGSNCYVTPHQRYAHHPQTIGFYFYGTEFMPKNLPLPRLQKHIWALAHEESPLNNFALNHAVGMNLFNYTATYHRASDYPITTFSFPGEKFILNRSPVSTSIKNEYQKNQGFAPLIYVQSHCEVPSDRDRYVEELMQYIKVDSYGQCTQCVRVDLKSVGKLLMKVNVA